MFLSLITFCVISFALGLIVYDKLRPYGDIEAFVMSFLFGVCVYPILGIILSFFNEVVIYFILAIGLFVIGIRINIKKLILPSLKPSKYELLAVVFALLMFGVFYYGGVSYPWLEDGDPNGHAVAASYIAHYHTFSKPADMFIARYMEPYPVGFQLWMGTLAQDGFNIVSTLKFYNYVFIALGILAFFCFVRVLTGDDRLALFSTFILTSIPTFSTRFIFSQAFATTQVIVILYFIALAIKKSNELYLARNSLGNENTTFSSMPMFSVTTLPPHAFSWAMTSLTRISGADAPAVTPTLFAPSTHSCLSSLASSIR